ncbi:MAG: TraB/GumN family protein, partial [Sphingopyxis sp.]
DADPALWVVRDADTTIYLFGTIHVLRPGLSWFDEAVADAFNASDELKIELIQPQDQSAMAALIQRTAIYSDGITLISRLTEEQRTTFLAALQQYGVQPEAFDTLKPWYASLMLTMGAYQAMGFTPDNGAEHVLTEAANAAHKPITAFETAEEQIGFLSSTPESEQIAGLLQFFTHAREIRQNTANLLSSWSDGNPEATATIFNEASAEAPETMRILLTDRNRRWAETLAARMEQPGTLFVAVGAGHLAGDMSVQHFLNERGIIATRVAY